MKITHSQLRRLIRESVEDEQLMYIEKVQKLFPSDANQAIELADMAGVGDTLTVLAMKDARELIVKFLQDWVAADKRTYRAPGSKWAFAGDYGIGFPEQERRRAVIGDLQGAFYDVLEEAADDMATRPLRRAWSNLTPGWIRGPKYEARTIEEANELADWAGVPHPELEGV
jgi:hypothetical protein